MKGLIEVFNKRREEIERQLEAYVLNKQIPLVERLEAYLLYTGDFFPSTTTDNEKEMCLKAWVELGTS